jgi:benzoyl-CoA reductase/2-hydroxyglutaryl-CoA dehydratase subunit BcrC/BadD/HgdB
VWEPYTSLNWGNKTSTGRLDLTRPFHTLAEKYTNVWTNKPVAKRFEYFDGAIRDYEVDGLVTFSNRSCRPMSMGQHELVQLVTKRHGLPCSSLRATRQTLTGSAGPMPGRGSRFSRS